MKKKHFTYNLDDVKRCFEDALWYCTHIGVDWREHIQPMVRDKMMVGYFVLDETKSTAAFSLEF